MRQFGMVVPPGAYLASVGAMVDSYALTVERRQNFAPETGAKIADTKLTVLSVDGHPVLVGGEFLYTVERPIASTDRFDFIWLPAFRFRHISTVRQLLDSSQELIIWPRSATGSCRACSTSTPASS